jgi:hypothetical protein
MPTVTITGHLGDAHYWMVGNNNRGGGGQTDGDGAEACYDAVV